MVYVGTGLALSLHTGDGYTHSIALKMDEVFRKWQPKKRKHLTRLQGYCNKTNFKLQSYIRMYFTILL